PGDDPGAGHRRFEHDVLGPKMAEDLMRNRAVLDRDPNQVLLGVLDGFRDRFGYFGSFPFADPDPSLLIPHNDQGGKIEPLAHFDNLRHTINENNLILEIQFVGINLHTELARPEGLMINSGRRDSLSAPGVFISISPTQPWSLPRQTPLPFG